MNKNASGFKCHFHDKLCRYDLPYCNACRDNPPDEEKPNGLKPPVKFYFPYCPSCGEPAYSDSCCVFCGQHFIQENEEDTDMKSFVGTDNKGDNADIEELDLFDMLDEDEE